MSGSEAQLWKQVKIALSNQGYFLTRIETLTVSGVPDVFGIYKSKSFWCELKSNQVNYPTLNKYHIVWINRAVKGQKHKTLKIYRIRSFFTDPRALEPDFVIKIPIRWPLFVDHFTRLLLTD